MKSYTTEEFATYLKGLEFEELEDMANFVTLYYEHYYSIPEANKEEKEAAWAKYLMLMARYGMTFVSFTSGVIQFRKSVQDELKAAEESGSAGTLEKRVN